MKKGMKALSSFNHIEMGQVFQALHHYRNNLNRMQKLLFDLVFIKITRRKNLHSLRELVFDGMEMKLLAKALRERATFYIDIKNYSTSIRYFELVQVIEEDLYQFQKEHGPKIEKAPTVRAVSAGYKIV